MAARKTRRARQPAFGSPLDPAAPRSEKMNAHDSAHKVITAHERHALIQRKAYQRAEQRGFAGDGELEDWLEAEREIDSEFGPRRDATRGEDSTDGHD